MFDIMSGGETTAPALFDDQVIQDCLGRLVVIKKDMDTDSRPKKWAERTRAGDKEAIFAELDTYYLQHNPVLTVIKSK